MNTAPLPPGVTPLEPYTARHGESPPRGVAFEKYVINPDAPTFVGLSPVSEFMRRTGQTQVNFTPDAVVAAAIDYTRWVEDNPLYETKTQYSKDAGKWVSTRVPKMRAMTYGGFQLFCGIGSNRLADWRKIDEYSTAMDFVDLVIKTQKFEGAAAGLLNAVIVARDLGLADKQEVSGPGGGAIRNITTDMSAEEAAEAWAEIRDG